MNKPDGMIETWVLQELKDGNNLWGFFRDWYGVRYEYIGVDERTGEIYERE